MPCDQTPPGSFAQTNASARLISQFDMPGKEVGMEVGQKDILDRVSTGLRIGQILLNVTLRIDHGSGLSSSHPQSCMTHEPDSQGSIA
jgi:hypothetical protein